MLRISFLVTFQLVWILRSSATMTTEKVTIPAPIVVKPSQTFDGVDGPWSSFNISVGTPAQDLRVFVSTSITRNLVVTNDGTCNYSQPNCGDSRGGFFYSQNSSTWELNHLGGSGSVYPMSVDQQLGYVGQAVLGFDVLSLDGQAETTTLHNQTIGYFLAQDSYLGLLALNPLPSLYSAKNLPVSTINSSMQDLQTNSLIPSLSWGYTAGSKNRNAFGSLTLGGYDSSRFVSHDGSWPISDDNSLIVQLDTIKYVDGTGTGQGQLLPMSINATIDSSESFIWLPELAYKTFEEIFGLTWDNQSNLYLINDSMHTSLVERNTSLTFSLSGMTGGSTTSVDIVLPYSAFDLVALPPFIGNQSRYYPLKRAANSTQFVIGRTFFQEAYVVADYERKNFSVYPAQWPVNPQPNIVSILSPSLVVSNPPSTNVTISNKSSSKSSNTGPIVGGVIGGIAVVAAAIAAIWYFCYWKPKKRNEEYTTHGEKPPELFAALPANHALALQEDRTTNRAELASTQPMSEVPELEGSVGHGKMFEMPVHEEAASEMGAPNSNRHEMETPVPMTGTTVSDNTDGFPWRGGSVREGHQRMSSSGQLTSFLVSPVSSASPAPSPPIFAPSPSPPPVAQPQPQRVQRPNLKTGYSTDSTAPGER